jgi:hypothetical protein
MANETLLVLRGFNDRFPPIADIQVTTAEAPGLS